MENLKLENFSTGYANNFIIKSIDLSVKSGEWLGVIGPNGAGKTSCFYMIIGLVEQDGGKVKIGEENISDLPIHGRAERGPGPAGRRREGRLGRARAQGRGRARPRSSTSRLEEIERQP